MQNAVILTHGQHLLAWQNGSWDLDESPASASAPRKAASGRRAPASGGKMPHLYLTPASEGTEESDDRKRLHQRRQCIMTSMSENVCARTSGRVYFLVGSTTL